MASVPKESIPSVNAEETVAASVAARRVLMPQDLHCVPCALPRPTEPVIWYSDCTPRCGSLVGHDARGAPVVRNHLGDTQTLITFDQLRLKVPGERLGPNWCGLVPPARIVRPHPHETAAFKDLLNRRIPPGPKYLELIEEIALRGYEVFVVGGTVRDILAGTRPKDVDVVTSMPLQRAEPLLRSMYRTSPDISFENGFVRIGGAPKSGDPFIDLKSMIHSNPGAADVVFASSLLDDTSHRDFACNAVYYCPINNALIDPAGCGISGADRKVLDLVSDPERPPFQRAKICVRYFKFIQRGFTADSRTIDAIRNAYLPCLPVMKPSQIVSYVRSQLLGKAAPSEHERVLEEFRVAMCTFGASASWDEYLAPLVSDMLEQK